MNCKCNCYLNLKAYCEFAIETKNSSIIVRIRWFAFSYFYNNKNCRKIDIFLEHCSKITLNDVY